MDFIRLYGYLVVVCLLTEGLLNARLLKYRKTFNIRDEIFTTCLNSFIPIGNVICLIKNILMIISKDDTIKAMALILDLANIDKEE